MKKRNIMTMALSLALVGAVAVGGTLAYFTSTTDTKSNVFTTGNVTASIIDESPAESGLKTGVENESKTGLDFTEAMPGDTYSKHVAIQLDEGSSDAWVALSVKVSVVDGKAETEDAMTDAQKQAVIDAINLQIHYQSNGWEYVATTDGGYVFYCTDIQAAGDNARDLFKTIEFPDEWGNECANITVTIDVQGAAVQAANVVYDDAKVQLNKLLGVTPVPQA